MKNSDESLIKMKANAERLAKLGLQPDDPFWLVVEILHEAGIVLVQKSAEYEQAQIAQTQAMRANAVAAKAELDALTQQFLAKMQNLVRGTADQPGLSELSRRIGSCAEQFAAATASYQAAARLVAQTHAALKWRRLAAWFAGGVLIFLGGWASGSIPASREVRQLTQQSTAMGEHTATEIRALQAGLTAVKRVQITPISNGNAVLVTGAPLQPNPTPNGPNWYLAVPAQPQAKP